MLIFCGIQLYKIIVLYNIRKTPIKVASDTEERHVSSLTCFAMLCIHGPRWNHIQITKHSVGLHGIVVGWNCLVGSERTLTLASTKIRQRYDDINSAPYHLCIAATSATKGRAALYGFSQLDAGCRCKQSCLYILMNKTHHNTFFF